MARAGRRGVSQPASGGAGDNADDGGDGDNGEDGMRGGRDLPIEEELDERIGDSNAAGGSKAARWPLNNEATGAAGTKEKDNDDNDEDEEEDEDEDEEEDEEEEEEEEEDE